MFEYLMPLLFTRTFENSLLERACRDAVDRQIEYGNENGVPWGISESGFSAIDANGIYQYRAFGVPALALDPSAEGELVVAPYATVLALQVDAPAAAANLQRLALLGLSGSRRVLRSHRFHPPEQARRRARRHHLLLHGASSGHEPGRAQ